MCYTNGYRDAATVNSLRLLDSYKNVITFKDVARTSDGEVRGSEPTILKLHKKEAELLRPYFESVLRRAMATYEKKYQMTLPGPVQVEVLYPLLLGDLCRGEEVRKITGTISSST